MRAVPVEVQSTIEETSSRAAPLNVTWVHAPPLSVEQEWNVLAIAYETASTVEPGDQASMQKAADTIRAFINRDLPDTINAQLDGVQKVIFVMSPHIPASIPSSPRFTLGRFFPLHDRLIVGDGRRLQSPPR